MHYTRGKFILQQITLSITTLILEALTITTFSNYNYNYYIHWAAHSFLQYIENGTERERDPRTRVHMLREQSFFRPVKARQGGVQQKKVLYEITKKY